MDLPESTECRAHLDAPSCLEVKVNLDRTKHLQLAVVGDQVGLQAAYLYILSGMMCTVQVHSITSFMSKSFAAVLRKVG